ncbi:MAG TPA: VWA domain-containing protein [Thermoanaerobaculia bacterium]|nr:VWA domain-containing protein [Thermoanaerobaculia bacterium]
MKRFLLAVAFCSALSAQQQQRYGEQVTVNVVEVPVLVTHNGRAVRGLTANDFELFVNGAKQPIQYFDVVDEGTTSLPPTASSGAADRLTVTPLDRRRMIVLLFDIATTSHHLLKRAKDAAQKFVDEALPGDTFAVARLGRDGAQFVVPFTTDRAVLHHAIATLSLSRAGDVFNLAVLPEERMIAPSSDVADTQTPEPADAFINADNSQFPIPEAAYQSYSMNLERQINEQRRRDDQNAVADDLGTLADRLASLNGVKHVILLSEGGTGGADFGALRKMHARFKAAGVILDGVELEGMTVPTEFTPTARANGASRARRLAPENDTTTSLYMLALDTGGTVTKHGDVAEALRTLRDMQRVTYVLGFTPPEHQKKDNTITVRVLHQPFGTTVNHRRGYSSASRVNRGDALFLADVLMNDIPQRGLTVDAKVQGAPRQALVTASVPGAELLARRADRDQVLVDVFMYVFDEKNLPAGWAYSRLNIDLAKGREFLESNPYTVRQRFNLIPGKYSAKVLLRFVGTDVAGFQRSDFSVTP